MEGTELPLGTLETLPLETLCGVIAQMRLGTLVSFMKASHRVREVARACVTELTLRKGEMVPASFVLSLPHLHRVNGTILIVEPSEEAVVRQIRGPLTISKTRLEGQELDLLFVRSRLYPTSPIDIQFLAYYRPKRSFLQRRREPIPSLEEPQSFSHLAYNPMSRSLTIPQLRDLPNKERLGTLIRTLSIEKLVVPDGFGFSYEREQEIIGRIPVRELEVTDWFVFFEYLDYRVQSENPILLEKIHFIPYPGTEIMQPDSTLGLFFDEFSEGTDPRSRPPYPTVKEIEGVGEGEIEDPSEVANTLRTFFPSLQRLGIIGSQEQVQRWRQELPGVEVYPVPPPQIQRPQIQFQSIFPNL